ncbi:NRDE family protein [Paenibacillus sp. GP183]|uniref:NRDE family protein n=1 Tax=Paenibacillus sp. GP183 TaxID=1882751 RepID=UPI00089D3EB0|nr:NRDE family protein [Paenibacillus sp. GP183]SEB53276.1 Uncharacterized conserved protein, contains NRDE domain [Paenibacillus sp. GP183]
MCLILFAYQAHDKYKLIMAANRDEFYERPTAPVHFWEDYPNILAGRDLLKMGTWMGVTTAGRFAALTNYRNPKEQTDGKRSRGELAADFLKNNEHPETYMYEMAKKRNVYPGYNLLSGDANGLYYYSNTNNKVQKLEPGIYGISNHLLDSDWPKVTKGKVGLSKIITESNPEMDERILNLLQKADQAPDEMLPNTGVALEWERILSPIFIKSEGYGTRSSTVLLISDEEISVRELVYSHDGMKDHKYSMPIQ